MINKFKQFVDELSQSNSRIYKTNVIEKYKDDEDVKYCLYYLLNPYIVTGVSDKKYGRAIQMSAHEIKMTFPQLLSFIKENNTGTDATLQVIGDYYHAYITPEIEPIFKGIITKNLPIGIDDKTVNKVIPKYIPTFNVQLANKYFEHPDYVENKVFTLTKKIDGCRIIALKHDGKVEFYTRQGQKYEGLVDLEKEMMDRMPDNLCLDGEITLLDKGNLVSKDQYKATTKIVRSDGIKHGVKMLVFDMMTADEFINQSCPRPYKERREHMENLFSQVLPTYFNLLDNLYTGTDSNEILKVLHEQVAMGEEGIMINISDAPYHFSRCNDLLKVKVMKDLDLEIIDYFEGTNSNKGKLGGFIVRYKDGNLVRVGSGYSKEFREEAWTHPQDYIGRILATQYFEETQNADGGLSLRFPVALEIRDPSDKNTPDF